MQQSNTTQPDADSAVPVGTAKAADHCNAYAKISTLARQASLCPSTVPNYHQFYRGVLSHIAGAFASPYATLYIRLSSQVIQEDFHCGPTDPGFWKAAVQQYLTEALEVGTAGTAVNRPRAKLLSAKESSLRITMMSAPLFDSNGSQVGAIALVAEAGTAMGDRDPYVQVERLQALTAFACHVADFVGSPPSAAEIGPQTPSRSLARASVYESPEELAFSLTNSLNNKLGCEQAALGMVKGRRCRVISISGLDDVRRRSPGVMQLRAAMEECLDFGSPITCQGDQDSAGAPSFDSDRRVGDGPPATDAPSTGHRLHRQWRQATGGGSVTSIPLLASAPYGEGKTDEGCVAILSLRRTTGEPFTREEINSIHDTVAPYAPALLLLKRANRGVLSHAWDSVAGAVAALRQPGRSGMRAAVVLTILFVGWLIFGTMNYELTVPCVIVPAHSRQVTAPYDGLLTSAGVVTGDRVRAGQVLCRLDHQDLDLQRGELAAQLTVVEQERLWAVAENARVDVKLAAANEKLLRTKLQIVDRRIERAAVRSPIDGMIVGGDLRKLVGGVVSRGEPLFEVAPADQWMLEIAVPEWSMWAQSSDLAPGLTGRFVSHARPEESTTFQLGHVRAKAELRDDRNVFVAEADLNIDAPWIRPGMEGVAQIHLGRRPVWWLAIHRVIDYLRLNFWL